VLLICLPYIARSRVPRHFAIFSARIGTQGVTKYVGSVVVPLEWGCLLHILSSFYNTEGKEFILKFRSLPSSPPDHSSAGIILWGLLYIVHV
jgi:hypothetical protein